MEVHQLLDGLDPAQRKAVTEPTHPIAILAGAGSGKTRVLTRRIAHRCLVGDADPRHVLAVTFTRKAAVELDARLRALGLRDLPAAGTFHALAYAQLRPMWEASPGGVPTVLDRKGRLLGRILGGTRRVSPADLAAEIEWAKARLVSPDGYVDAVERADRRPPVEAERIADWYRRYEQDKRRRGVVDFDDLLAEAADRIENDLSVAASQRWRFRHLFVDEYQDVNPLQERLLRAWLGDRTDLCVVGDPNQAIYGWNGADPDLLRRFAEHHPGAAVIELRDSYRSSPQILAVAASVLGDGRVRPLTAHRTDGPVPVVVGYRSELDEANAIARAVRDHHRPGRPWSAQAVLVRTNAQAAVIETALRRAAVPVRVRGGRAFLDDPEVRDLLDRFGRMREPLSTVLDDLAAGTDRRRAEQAEAVEEVDDPKASTASTGPVAEASALARRLATYDEIVRLGRELLVVDPHADVSAFPGWLRTVLLDDDPAGADAVTLATFHAAKGLEWDVVHLAGLEDGYVPISHARSPEAREEEVRLLYVAVTRASEVLRCSWSATRTFGESTVDRRPSPLLARLRESVQGLARREVVAVDPSSGLEASRAALRADPVRASATDSAALTRSIEDAIRRWRDDQARRSRVRPSVVLADRALIDIAREQPRDLDALGRAGGLGPVARDRHGAALLAVVAEVLDAAPGARADGDARAT